MKLRALFVALFVAGLAASIALAAPADNGGTTAAGTTSSTSTGKKHEHGDNQGDHQNKGKNGANGPTCREVELKGTIASGTLSIAVDTASKSSKGLAGTSVTVAYGGKVKLHARLCAAAGAAAGTGTLELRELKAQDKHGDAGTTTGATTTTP